MKKGNEWIDKLAADLIGINGWGKEDIYDQGARAFAHKIFPEIWRRLHKRNPQVLGEIASYGGGMVEDAEGNEYVVLGDGEMVNIHDLHEGNWIDDYRELLKEMSEWWGKYINLLTALIYLATMGMILRIINKLLVPRAIKEGESLSP